MPLDHFFGCSPHQWVVIHSFLNNVTKLTVFNSNTQTDFNYEYVQREALRVPLVFRDKDGLGIK